MTNKQVILHCQGSEVRPEVLAFAKENGMVLAGGDASGDTTADTQAPSVGSGEPDKTGDTGPDKDDGTDVAVAQLVAVNTLLDEVSPHDPEDMDLVDRVRRLVSQPEKRVATPLGQAELVVPAPVMAALLGQMMKVQYNDQRFTFVPSEMVAGGQKWEFACREGLFVGQFHDGWDKVSEANHGLVTINSEISELFRQRESARTHFDRATRALEAEQQPARTRVVSHKEVKKGGKKVLEPVVVPVEDRRRRDPIDVLQQRHKEAHTKLRAAERALKAKEDHRAWCKRTIEESVPQEFTFSLADLASGRVRVGDEW